MSSGGGAKPQTSAGDEKKRGASQEEKKAASDHGPDPGTDRCCCLSSVQQFLRRSGRKREIKRYPPETIQKQKRPLNAPSQKNKEKPEAYAGLSKTYIAQDDPDAAEAVFLTALEDQNNNADPI